MKTTTIPSELTVESIFLRKAALVFRVINHKLRQQMLMLLHQNKRMTVTQIYAKLNLEQSVTSQHLAILREAQIVKTEGENRFIYYSVNYKRLEEIHECAVELTKN